MEIWLVSSRNVVLLLRSVLFRTITNSTVKVAEHSFSARFCWCNLARALGFQKTNMPPTERSFYLLNTRTICVIFLYNCIALCVDGFSISLQRYVQKVTMQRTQQFSAFVCYRKNPVKCNACAVAQKLRPIALAEKCRFLAIQSLEFQEIWQKK